MKFSWAISAVDESLSVLAGLFRIISVHQEWRRNLNLPCLWALRFARPVLTQYILQPHARYSLMSQWVCSFPISLSMLEARKQNVMCFLFFAGGPAPEHWGRSSSSVNGERLLMAVGLLTPVSEATALGSSCDWEELKPFFYEKVWSQWSHFRDMLQ